MREDERIADHRRVVMLPGGARRAMAGLRNPADHPAKDQAIGEHRVYPGGEDTSIARIVNDGRHGSQGAAARGGGLCLKMDVPLTLMQSDGLLDDISHPNKEKYPYQRVFVVAIDGYVYLVPYVENDEEIFLKTVAPSRKATKQYLGGQYLGGKR